MLLKDFFHVAIFSFKETISVCVIDQWEALPYGATVG